VVVVGWVGRSWSVRSRPRWTDAFGSVGIFPTGDAVFCVGGLQGGETWRWGSTVGGVGDTVFIGRIVTSDDRSVLGIWTDGCVIVCVCADLYSSRSDRDLDVTGLY